MDEGTLLIVTMGCKEWSGGAQRGLRIYTPTILELTAALDKPSLDGRWSSLAEFVNAVRAGLVPGPYSRSVQVVRDGYPAINATMTIARHGRTTQGYLTAPRGSWFYEFVTRQLDRNMPFQYVSDKSGDVVVIPKPAMVGRIPDPDNEAMRMKAEIERQLRRENRPPPPDAKAIGLYFETQEVQRINSEGLTPLHRYPLITSNIPKLQRAGISCDIDVVRANGTFVKCVEVKAVSGPSGGEFHLTRREYESRIECRRRNWIYEIIVYYHVGKLIIERLRLDPDSNIRTRLSGYWCRP